MSGFPMRPANRLPRSGDLDDLGLEKADDAFGEGIATGLPDAADGCVDARLCEPFGVSDRQVLAAPLALVDPCVRL